MGLTINKLVYEKTSNSKAKICNHVKSPLGILLIVFSLLLIHKNRSFPGWWALLPVLGSILIISAGAQSWLNKVLLSNRILVWFGLISYPLYLWHWPILSFLRIAKDGALSGVTAVGAVLLAIFLSCLTYWYIEQPIRRMQRGGRYIFYSLLGLMVLVGLFGYSVYYLNGIPFRNIRSLQIVNPGEIGHDLYLVHKANMLNLNLCNQYVHRDACFQKNQTGRKKLAVIGDSHADDLSIGFATQLPALNVVFYDALGLPLLNTKEGATHLEEISRDKDVSTVILAGAWIARWASIVPPSSLESELTAVVNKLSSAGKKVYISDDVPSFSFVPARCKYNGWWMRQNQCSETINYFFKRRQIYYPIFESVAKKTDMKILNITNYFCDDDFCSMKGDGRLMFRDNNHLNFEGVKYVASRIIKDYPHLLD